jgi:hypothetical protein
MHQRMLRRVVWYKDFSVSFRVQTSYQLPVQWVPGVHSRGYSGRGVNLATHFNLVSGQETVEQYLHYPISLQDVDFSKYHGLCHCYYYKLKMKIVI